MEHCGDIEDGENQQRAVKSGEGRSKVQESSVTSVG